MQPLSKALLQWYYANKRDLPWRSNSGTIDPYYVWLSEIMLQQTTVETVKPYFIKFTNRWRTVHDLANAKEETVMEAWAGLGYYARARNLYKCAQHITFTCNGKFPNTEQELLKLPGIGTYTAAAIAAIAFGKKTVIVDANVERIITRLFNIQTPLPKAKPLIYEKMKSITPEKKAGDLAQGMMDLTSSICKSKKPKCLVCPIKPFCLGKEIAITLPRKIPKSPKPVRKAYMYVALNTNRQILLERRPKTGLLGGMLGLPTTRWEQNYPTDHNQAPLSSNWQELRETTTHTFTHFHLISRIFVCNSNSQIQGYYWDNIQGLPTVFKKVAHVALKHFKA